METRLTMRTKIKIWRLRLRIGPRLAAARLLLKASKTCFSLSKILWELSIMLDARLNELLDNCRAVLKE